MTATTDTRPPHAAPPTPDPDPAVGRDLRTLIYGTHYNTYRAIHARIYGVGGPTGLGRDDADEAEYGYRLLERIGAALDGSWADVAADIRTQSALYDATMVRHPRALPFLSHVSLGIGSIQALGNGSRYQRHLLADLDRGDAIGVFAATELGVGTNIIDAGTVAIYDRVDRTLILDSADNPEAWKWMPNLGSSTVPKILVVLARLVVDGADAGVFPIVFRARTAAGLVPGLEVASLPTSRLSAPMDHAVFRFRSLRVPADALLGGDWAHFDEDGTFHCELSLHARFKKSAVSLLAGRLSYAGSAVAAARAGWTLVLRYASQRDIDGTLLIDRDEPQRKMARAAAQLCAMSALVEYARDRFDGPPEDAAAVAALVMATKPLVSDTAWTTLADIAISLCGAQAVLGPNMFGDWLADIVSVRIAEGTNPALRIAAGRPPTLYLTSSIEVPGVPEDLPWWHRMIHDRARTVAAAAAAAADGPPVGDAIGPDSTATDTQKVVTERIAVDAMAAATARITDPAARGLAEQLTALYALDTIRGDAKWFDAHHPDYDRAYAVAAEREVRTLYADIARQLPAIADAFAVPRLPAPIDRDYLTAWPRRLHWTT